MQNLTIYVILFILGAGVVGSYVVYVPYYERAWGNPDAVCIDGVVKLKLSNSGNKMVDAMDNVLMQQTSQISLATEDMFCAMRNGADPLEEDDLRMELKCIKNIPTIVCKTRLYKSFIIRPHLKENQDSQETQLDNSLTFKQEAEKLGYPKDRDLTDQEAQELCKLYISKQNYEYNYGDNDKVINAVRCGYVESITNTIAGESAGIGIYYIDVKTLTLLSNEEVSSRIQALAIQKPIPKEKNYSDVDIQSIFNTCIHCGANEDEIYAKCGNPTSSDYAGNHWTGKDLKISATFTGNRLAGNSRIHFYKFYNGTQVLGGAECGY